MPHTCCLIVITCVAMFFACPVPGFGGQEDVLLAELRGLVDEKEEAFLLSEIRRVQPPHTIRNLSRYQATQHLLGGGFHGDLPDQLINVQDIPLPVDEIGVLQAALFLARQRQENRDAVAGLGFPLGFGAGRLPDEPASSIPGVQLTLDLAVPQAFLEALSDGEVTVEESIVIARLPGNREMIRHCREHGDDPEPRMTEQGLVYFITHAGSPRPLDRIWCWLNPMNFFGYADIAMNPSEYRELVDVLQHRGQDLTSAAASRVAPYIPEGVRVNETFALIIGNLDANWNTADLAGLNIGLIKNDWQLLVRTVAMSFSQRLQLRVCCTAQGGAPAELGDLLCGSLVDPRYERLYEMVAYMVLEGTADYIADPVPSAAAGPNVVYGADLIERYVSEVIDLCHVHSADAIVTEGWGSDGPLCALGRHMARIVAEHDGPDAISEWLRQGPIAFIERVNEIESANGTDVLDPRVMSALRALSVRLEREPPA